MLLINVEKLAETLELTMRRPAATAASDLGLPASAWRHIVKTGQYDDPETFAIFCRKMRQQPEQFILGQVVETTPAPAKPKPAPAKATVQASQAEDKPKQEQGQAGRKPWGKRGKK